MVAYISIAFMVASLALGQSFDSLNGNEVTLDDVKMAHYKPEYAL